MCVYVCSSACMHSYVWNESAHTAFLILENQKQIIGKEKTQAVLRINWAQMEAGNKKEKTLGEKEHEGEDRTG